jgi:methylmalonyl-CoA mutase N-terminal domain/subunit
MFAITLVAVGAAAAAWLRPMPETKSATPTAPAFSAQQVADAKSEVCSAYAKVHRAVGVNAPRNGGNDPTAQLAVATNMRQIYGVGSAYLLTTLTDEPGAPTELATATSKIAKLFQVLTIEGSVSDPSAEAYNEVNETGVTIESLCK